MRAVETSMKIHQENVGFLSLCTELGSRMGATLVLSCLKGTDATAMSLTLEQVILLTRCHGLPPKSFQTALSVMRSQVSHTGVDCLCMYSCKLYPSPLFVAVVFVKHTVNTYSLSGWKRKHISNSINL